MKRPCGLGVVVTQYLGRTALSKRIFTGLQPGRLGRLIAGLAGAWMAAEESRLHERRGHERMRAPGAGPDHELPFTDRVIVTLVMLRFQLPHAALAELYQVDRSTVTRAVREVRPLLAARGFAVHAHPDLRLRTLADVFAYAAAEGIDGLLDQFPEVKAKVDAGYRGLAKEFPGQVQAPPLKPKKNAPPEETAAWDAQRHQQSSERICVEHANAEHKQWRTLQRFLGRRENFDETYTAIAGLVSDRAAER